MSEDNTHKIKSTCPRSASFHTMGPIVPSLNSDFLVLGPQSANPDTSRHHSQHIFPSLIPVPLWSSPPALSPCLSSPCAENKTSLPGLSTAIPDFHPTPASFGLRPQSSLPGPPALTRSPPPMMLETVPQSVDLKDSARVERKPSGTVKRPPHRT